jgi:hypothetical protein
MQNNKTNSVHILGNSLLYRHGGDVWKTRNTFLAPIQRRPKNTKVELRREGWDGLISDLLQTRCNHTVQGIYKLPESVRSIIMVLSTEAKYTMEKDGKNQNLGVECMT